MDETRDSLGFVGFVIHNTNPGFVGFRTSFLNWFGFVVSWIRHWRNPRIHDDETHESTKPTNPTTKPTNPRIQHESNITNPTSNVKWRNYESSEITNPMTKLRMIWSHRSHTNFQPKNWLHYDNCDFISFVGFDLTPPPIEFFRFLTSFDVILSFWHFLKSRCEFSVPFLIFCCLVLLFTF